MVLCIVSTCGIHGTVQYSYQKLNNFANTCRWERDGATKKRKRQRMANSVEVSSPTFNISSRIDTKSGSQALKPNRDERDRERVCKKCWTLCSLCNIVLFKQCILAFSSTNSSNDTFHISPYTQNELMPMVHRLLFFVHYSNFVCRVLVCFRFILLTLYIHGLNRQKCCHQKMNYRNIVSTFYYQHKLNSEFDSSAHFKCFIN